MAGADYGAHAAAIAISSAPALHGTSPKMLRQWVERCLHECESEAERARMDRAVRSLIHAVASQQPLATYDWAREPVPLQKRRYWANRPSSRALRIAVAQLGARQSGRRLRQRRSTPTSLADA